jgi:glucose-1-phosphate adenylyltransferase
VDDVITLILGGGRGTRLFPLTRYRSKPAVPLGGKFRLVDIPISNALHAGLNRIFILTQFNSASLHRHVSSTYNFSHIAQGFVDILAASQTLQDQVDWYEGTADAVRKTLSHLEGYRAKRVLILSGDQLYRMDFRQVLEEHARRGAEVTVAGVLKPAAGTTGLGIMRLDAHSRITGFVEKPKDTDQLTGFEIPTEVLPEKRRRDAPLFAASMGIYIWELEALREALLEHHRATDFGHEIIPAAIEDYRVFCHLFDGYWEDIGTIGSFYQANLALVEPDPPFEFFHRGQTIYTHPRNLPPARVMGGSVRDVILAEGADLSDCTVRHSVVGVRSLIRKGAEIHDTVLLGADEYPRSLPEDGSPVPIGIGEDSEIRRAIVDKNARIGRGVHIEGREGSVDREEEHFYVRDGIVVIPKNAVLPDKTRIKA